MILRTNYNLLSAVSVPMTKKETLAARSYKILLVMFKINNNLSPVPVPITEKETLATES
jgi:hypothetical protein